MKLRRMSLKCDDCHSRWAPTLPEDTILSCPKCGSESVEVRG